MAPCPCPQSSELALTGAVGPHRDMQPGAEDPGAAEGSAQQDPAHDAKHNLQAPWHSTPMGAQPSAKCAAAPLAQPASIASLLVDWVGQHAWGSMQQRPATHGAACSPPPPRCCPAMQPRRARALPTCIGPLAMSQPSPLPGSWMARLEKMAKPVMAMASSNEAAMKMVLGMPAPSMGGCNQAAA